MKTAKVPKGALRFVDTSDNVCAFAIDDGDAKKLKMTAYSGGVIKNHWYWGNLAIDLSGMKIPSGKFPILEDHNTGKKIAFTKKPALSDSLVIDPENTQFVSTPESEEFQRLSAEGFPYQASIYAPPAQIQRLGEDETAEVNGYTFKGPGTIFRKSTLKEASVCVFGWDSETQSTAFSRKEQEEIEVEDGSEIIDAGSWFSDTTDSDIDVNVTEEGGEQEMKFAELKEKHPELFAEVVTFGKQEAEKAFAKKETQFQETIDSMSKKVEDGEERMAKLEKENALNRESALKAQADGVFFEKFAETDFPDRLKGKIRSQLNHQKFIKDDKLDVEAFVKAVEEELKDWEGIVTSSVDGFSSTNRKPEGDGDSQTKLAKENDALANSLLSLAGQAPNTAT